MSALLTTVAKWEHSDLLLYIDNSAIYATSTTKHAATLTATKRYEEVCHQVHVSRLGNINTQTTPQEHSQNL